MTLFVGLGVRDVKLFGKVRYYEKTGRVEAESSADGETIERLRQRLKAGLIRRISAIEKELETADEERASALADEWIDKVMLLEQQAKR